MFDKSKNTVRNIVKDEVQPVDSRLIVLETKMDLIWSGIARDLASVLHHPEPTRQRVDYLLDKFKHDIDRRPRILSDTELSELKRYLEIIRDWEPGHAAPFTVYPGEQGHAALLLNLIDYVLPGEENK